MVRAKVRAATDGDAATALTFKARTCSRLVSEIEVRLAAAVQQLSGGIP